MAAETQGLYDRLADLTQQLAHMPRSKRGSAWEADRVRERDMIRRRIERLEGADEVPSYGAALAAYPRS